MREAVHEVLALRAPDPRGLSQAINWSIAVHLGVVLLLVLAPRLGWIKTKPPAKVLEISLGGNVGPKDTGKTTIGGQPVTQPAPEPKRPEIIKPVATKPDTMTVPTKVVPPKKTPPPPKVVKEEARAPSPAPHPPAPAREATPGNSRVYTGVTGMGTGLNIGASGLGGETSLSDFCCPKYLTDVVDRIKSKWDEHQAERGSVIVRFTIQRNGQVTGLEVMQHGSYLLDRASQVPFLNLQLSPLPAEFTPSSLTLRLTFEYK